MTRLTLIELGDGSAPITALRALPNVQPLDVAFNADASVPAIRARLLEAARSSGGFIISIDPGLGDPAVGVNWGDAEAKMRLAFATLTGAAAGLRERGGGPVLVLLPSLALVQPRHPTSDSIWLRAILGMAEALRAELGDTSTRVGIVFYALDTPDDTLPTRLKDVLAHVPMYSLSPDLTATRIRGYFEPILIAVDRSSAGPPLPDIGPMAVVYDLASIGLSDKR